MKTLAVIQARMGSTRLPGKVLKPLGGKPMLLGVVERVRAATRVEEVIVATSLEGGDDVIAKLLASEGIKCFRGSKDDVLGRYYLASQPYAPETIVRITADCPLADPGVIDRVIQEREKTRADYASNTLKRTYPRGADVEVFTFQALLEAYQEAQQPLEREHVTPFVWSRPQRFRLHNVEAEPELEGPDFRLTVDTEEDYALMTGIIAELGAEPSFREVIALLKRKPWLVFINRQIEQKKQYVGSEPYLNTAQEYLEASRLAIQQDLNGPGYWLAMQVMQILDSKKLTEVTQEMAKKVFQEAEQMIHQVRKV